jgi:hypothetical protein
VARIASETLQSRMRTPEGERDQVCEGLRWAIMQAQNRRFHLEELRKQRAKARPRIVPRDE